MGIDYLSDEIGRRLRRKGLLATTISISYKDEFLRVTQKQRPLPMATDIGKEIADVAYEITSGFWSLGKPIRTITITALGLIEREMSSDQMDMFSETNVEEDREKKRKMEETIDSIRSRFGGTALVRGTVLDNDIGIFDPKTEK